MKEERALVGNPGDEEQVRKADKVTEDRGRSERQALLDVLANYHGRRVLHWILGRAGLSQEGIFQLSYHGNVNDALYCEGRREVGQAVVAEILKANPAAYTLILEEARKRRENER